MLTGDRLHERHELIAQLGKDGAHGRGFHAIVRKVNQGIGNVLVTGEEIGELPAQVESLFEIRPHYGKVVRRPGFSPDLIRLSYVIVELRRKRRRHLYRFLIIAPRDADKTGLVRVVG